MRTVTAVLAGVVLWVSCGSPGSARPSDSHAAALEDSVAEYLSGWQAGPDERSWDGMAERYADVPGFVWVEDGRIRYESVSAIREAVGGLKSQFSSEETVFIEPRITPLAPGLAQVAARFRTTLGRAEASDVVYGGVLTMTVMHTDDGWAAIQGHTSTPAQSRRDEGSEGGPVGP